MNLYETTKLFWGKYLYKLSVHNELASIFRCRNLSNARQVLDELQQNYEAGLPLERVSWRRVNRVQEHAFIDAKLIYNSFKTADDYLLRIQYNTMNIYSNDESWLKYVSSILAKDSVLEFWAPSEDNIDILDSNTIIVPKSNGFEYKVTLNSALGNDGFATFATANPHLIKAGPVLIEEMSNNGYVNNLYFYARDQKVLNLCSLLLNNIRRIDKLVVK